MSYGLFRVKNVIFDQNRVHRVNTGQAMSTSFKNEFRAISGQKRHFRPKPSSPGQTMLTRVKNEFRVVSGQNCHFWPKSSSPGQYGSNHVDQGKKWVSGCFGSKPSFLTKTRFTGSIPIKCFFGIPFFFCGWNGLFLILIWIFNFTCINIYYYI